jgi:7-keto-8-aminopelargonate synthetase-like enzyme
MRFETRQLWGALADVMSAVSGMRVVTVTDGSARMRFSLTCGITNDELVRLENALNSWREHACWSAAVAHA